MKVTVVDGARLDKLQDEDLQVDERETVIYDLNKLPLLAELIDVGNYEYEMIGSILPVGVVPNDSFDGLSSLVRWIDPKELDIIPPRFVCPDLLSGRASRVSTPILTDVDRRRRSCCCGACFDD